MGNREKRQRRLRVRMEYAPAPDAGDRFARAIGILLKAVSRNTSQSKDSENNIKEEQPSQAPEEDAPTGGDKDGDPGG